MVKVKIIFAISFMLLIMSIIAFAETVGVFFDSKQAQIKFAATDVKTALESSGFKVEMWAFSDLKSD